MYGWHSGKLRQEYHRVSQEYQGHSELHIEFNASLDLIARFCLKNKQTNPSLSPV